LFKYIAGLRISIFALKESSACTAEKKMIGGSRDFGAETLWPSRSLHSNPSMIGHNDVYDGHINSEFLETRYEKEVVSSRPFSKVIMFYRYWYSLRASQ